MITVAKRHEIKGTQEPRIYYQTLEGHTADSLKILKHYFEKNQNSINSFSERWQIQPDQLMRNLFITLYLHDIGKLTDQFQKRIRQNKKSQMYPHPFFGFPIAYEIFKTEIRPLSSVKTHPMEPLVVLSHHSQPHEALYQSTEIRKVDPLEEEILIFLKNATEMYRALGFQKFFTLTWSKNELKSMELLKYEKSFGKIRKYLTECICASKNVKDLDEMIRIKSIFTYLLSIVKLCDFYSSAHFTDFCEKTTPDQYTLGPVLEIPEQFVLTLPELSTYSILKGNFPHEFQLDVQESSPYSLLFAPCGRGKTEAALLWALETCKTLNKNKIIFAMPTQTTSNALMDRFVKVIDNAGLPGKEMIGLYHGKSSIKLKEEIQEEKDDQDELDEDDIEEEVKTEEFKGNIFFKPITVTTIDHLLLSFVHGFPQADFACGNLQGAVIIFDEIHYYERQTLAHLVDLFTVLRKMNIPYLLMSGTLPDFIKKKLEEEAEKEGVTHSYVVDHEGLNFTPFKIESFSTPLVEKGKVNKDVLKEVRENFSKNLNQFIILNTVRRAQKFYDAIKEVNENSVFLLHSEFTYKDRTDKERRLIRLFKEKRRPIIVVSTQVIEISLDISCDVMYTERAPIDSLGQRGGRLNRGGKSWETHDHEFTMKVYLPENHLPYHEDTIEMTGKALLNGVYSYGLLKEVCDSVYGSEYLEEFEEKGELEGAYCFLHFGGRDSLFKECYLFGKKYNRIAFSEELGNLFVIRSENYRKFDVVPEIYYKGEEKNLIVENQVKVPYWWVELDWKMHGDELQWFEREEKHFKWKKKLYWVCKLPYDEKYGFNSSMLEKENERVGLIENIL